MREWEVELNMVARYVQRPRTMGIDITWIKTSIVRLFQEVAKHELVLPNLDRVLGVDDGAILPFLFLDSDELGRFWV